MSEHPNAADREQWRAEIADAKARLSKEEFTDWLRRKMDTAGQDTSPVPMDVQLAAANLFLDKFLERIANGRATGASDSVLFDGFLRNACAPERDPKAVGLALTVAMFRLAGPREEPT